MIVRVLHVITGLHRGGAETMLVKLLSMSDSTKLTHSVLAIKPEGPIADEIRALGVEVRSANLASKMAYIFKRGRLRRLALDVQPDIIQGWMYHANVTASWLGGVLTGDQAIVWNIRNSLARFEGDKLTTRLMTRAAARSSRRASAIVYNSQISRSQHRSAGYAGDRDVVIPNGFDCDLFKPCEVSRRRFRDAYRISADTLVIGSVARFHPMKDHKSLFEAAALVFTANPNALLVCIGRGLDADHPVLNGARKLLGDRLILIGETAEIDSILPGFDLFAMSSQNEGFPNAVGEAMATSVPCVVTDTGDAAFIVKNTGRVVPSRDPRALAAAILDLAALGSEQRRSLGGAARERIVNNFELSKIASHYDSLYLRLSEKIRAR